MAKRKTFSLNKDLQEGLTQTMTAVHNYAGELRYEIIPLQQLELDPENPRDLAISFEDLPHGPKQDDANYDRKVAEINSLNSLAETISKQGLINPIVVYKHGAKYRLVAGERRSLASKIAGKTDIKANVLNEKPTDYRRSLLQWIENIEREDLSLWERLHNIKMILSAYQKETEQKHKISPTLIKNILGCSLPHAMNYHAVLNSPKVILNAIEVDQIKNLEKAAFIAKLEPTKLQVQVMQACIDGASLRQLKQMAKGELTQEKTIQRQNTKNKLAAGRGRKATKVNLGATQSPYVARTIVDAVLNQERYGHYRSKFYKVNWDDYAQASQAFKELLIIVEKLEA